MVHYGGVACEMDALNTISSKYNIDIIEDNAHGLYGYYKDRALVQLEVLLHRVFMEQKT